MSTPVVGRLATLINGLDSIDGQLLSTAERNALQWLASVPAFTTADLIAVVRRIRMGTGLSGRKQATP